MELVEWWVDLDKERGLDGGGGEDFASIEQGRVLELLLEGREPEEPRWENGGALSISDFARRFSQGMSLLGGGSGRGFDGGGPCEPLFLPATCLFIWCRSFHTGLDIST